MDEIAEAIDEVAAATGFAGVVRVDRDGVAWARAYGLAHRGWSIPNAVDTRFGTASGTKSLTALAVASVVEEGRLDLARRRPAGDRRRRDRRAPAREPLGDRRLLRRGRRRLASRVPVAA